MTRWRSIGLALAFVSLGIPQAVEARAEEEADEAGETPLEALTLTDTAFTQEALELQVTLAPFWLHWSTPRTDAVGADLELEFGLSDRFQLSGEVSLARAHTEVSSATGVAGAELGLTWNALSIPNLVASVGVGVELPASDPALGSTAIGAGPFVLIDAALSRFHASLYAALALDAESAVEKSIGGALYADFRSVVPVLEILVVIEDEDEVLVAPGVFLHPAPAWEIGISGIAGLTESAPDYGARLQLTCELDLGGPERDPP